MRGCFLRQKNQRKKKYAKKTKTNTQKILKKEQKKEPAVDATVGSMLKRCFIKA